MKFINNNVNKQSKQFSITNSGCFSLTLINSMLYLNGYKQQSDNIKSSILDPFIDQQLSLIYSNSNTLITLDYNRGYYSNTQIKYHNIEYENIYVKQNYQVSSAIMNMPYEMVFNPQSAYSSSVVSNFEHRCYTTQNISNSGNVSDVSYEYIPGVSLGLNKSEHNSVRSESYSNNKTIDRIRLFRNYLDNTHDSIYRYPTYISYNYADSINISKFQSSYYNDDNVESIVEHGCIPILQTIDPDSKNNVTILFNYKIYQNKIDINLSKANSSTFDPSDANNTINNYSTYSIYFDDIIKPNNIRLYISNMLKTQELDKLDMREIYLPFFKPDRITGYSIKGLDLSFEKLSKNISSMQGRTDDTTSADVGQYYITQAKFKFNDNQHDYWCIQSEFMNVYKSGNKLTIFIDGVNVHVDGYSIVANVGKSYTITTVFDGINASTDLPHLNIYVDGILISSVDVSWDHTKNTNTVFNNINLEYFYFTEVLRTDVESAGINSMFNLVDSEIIKHISEKYYQYEPLFLIRNDELYSYDKYKNRYDNKISNSTNQSYNLITDIPNAGELNSEGHSISDYYEYTLNAHPSIIKFKLNIEEIDQIEDISTMDMQSMLVDSLGNHVIQSKDFIYSIDDNISFESLMYDYNDETYYIHNMKSVNKCITSLYKFVGNNMFTLVDQIDGLHDMLPINMNISNMFLFSDSESSVYYHKVIGNGQIKQGSYLTSKYQHWNSYGELSDYVYDNSKEYTIIFESVISSSSTHTSLFKVDSSDIQFDVNQNYINLYVNNTIIYERINLSEFDIILSESLHQIIINIKLEEIIIYIDGIHIYSGINHFKELNNLPISFRLGSEITHTKIYAIFESAISIDTIQSSTITDDNGILLDYSDLEQAPEFPSMNIIAAFDFKSDVNDISGNDRTITGSDVSILEPTVSYIFHGIDIQEEYRSGTYKVAKFTDSIKISDLKIGNDPISVLHTNTSQDESDNPVELIPIVNSNEIIFYSNNRHIIERVIHLGDFKYDVSYSVLDLSNPDISSNFSKNILDHAKDIYEVNVSIKQLLTSENIKNIFDISILPNYQNKSYLYEHPIYELKDDTTDDPNISAIIIIHSYPSISLNSALNDNTEDSNKLFKTQIMNYISTNSISSMIDNEQGIGSAVQLLNNISATDSTDINNIVKALSSNPSFNVSDNIITFTGNIFKSDMSSIFSEVKYEYEDETNIFVLDLVNGVTDIEDLKEITMDDCENNSTDNIFTINLSYIAKNSISETPIQSMSITKTILDDFKFNIDIPRLVPDTYSLDYVEQYVIQRSTINNITNEYKDIKFNLIITNENSNSLTPIDSFIEFEIQYHDKNSVYKFDFNPCNSICDASPYKIDMISENDYIQKSSLTTDLYMD